MIKERWVSKNFLIAGLKTACEGGEDGFVDDPFLGGVVGTIVDCDEVIEGFDEFGFGLAELRLVVV